MTQLTLIGTNARRRSDERLYGVLYLLGLAVALPWVAIRRLVPRPGRGSRLGTLPPRDGSVLAQARAEVNSVLAFVFMV